MHQIAAGLAEGHEVLRPRMPAGMVPNRLTDQPPRASRLATAGLVLAVDGEYPATSTASPRPRRLVEERSAPQTSPPPQS